MHPKRRRPGAALNRATVQPADQRQLKRRRPGAALNRAAVQSADHRQLKRRRPGAALNRVAVQPADQGQRNSPIPVEGAAINRTAVQPADQRQRNSPIPGRASKQSADSADEQLMADMAFFAEQVCAEQGNPVRGGKTVPVRELSGRLTRFVYEGQGIPTYGLMESSLGGNSDVYLGRSIVDKLASQNVRPGDIVSVLAVWREQGGYKWCATKLLDLDSDCDPSGCDGSGSGPASPSHPPQAEGGSLREGEHKSSESLPVVDVLVGLLTSRGGSMPATDIFALLHPLARKELTAAGGVKAFCTVHARRLCFVQRWEGDGRLELVEGMQGARKDGGDLTCRRRRSGSPRHPSPPLQRFSARHPRSREQSPSARIGGGRRDAVALHEHQRVGDSGLSTACGTQANGGNVTGKSSVVESDKAYWLSERWLSERCQANSMPQLPRSPPPACALPPAPVPPSPHPPPPYFAPQAGSGSCLSSDVSGRWEWQNQTGQWVWVVPGLVQASVVGGQHAVGEQQMCDEKSLWTHPREPMVAAREKVVLEWECNREKLWKALDERTRMLEERTRLFEVREQRVAETEVKADERTRLLAVREQRVAETEARVDARWRAYGDQEAQAAQEKRQFEEGVAAREKKSLAALALCDQRELETALEKRKVQLLREKWEQDKVEAENQMRVREEQVQKREESQIVREKWEQEKVEAENRMRVREEQVEKSEESQIHWEQEKVEAENRMQMREEEVKKREKSQNHWKQEKVEAENRMRVREEQVEKREERLREQGRNIQILREKLEQDKVEAENLERWREEQVEKRAERLREQQLEEKKIQSVREKWEQEKVEAENRIRVREEHVEKREESQIHWEQERVEAENRMQMREEEVKKREGRLREQLLEEKKIQMLREKWEEETENRMRVREEELERREESQIHWEQQKAEAENGMRLREEEVEKREERLREQLMEMEKEENKREEERGRLKEVLLKGRTIQILTEKWEQEKVESENRVNAREEELEKREERLREQLLEREEGDRKMEERGYERGIREGAKAAKKMGAVGQAEERELARKEGEKVGRESALTDARKVLEQEMADSAFWPECTICMDRPARTCLNPCGHSFCRHAECPSKKMKKCSLCQKTIKNTTLLFRNYLE